ncbi:MAG: hypothetical protein DDT31_01421 [Syntrophomonadaceae bacterium]|nr:hypothetical protein [Bacillota bacterium]
MSVKLTSDLIEAFAGTFLSPRYDNLKPTPQFHREAWELYCSSHPQCAVIAPRDHAKSTALTFSYVLAEVLFRLSDHVIIVGSTEDKAAEQLSNISEELELNADLRAEFKIKGFETLTKTEVIVFHDDGHRFRILARGSEQKIRGTTWKGKRPNLLLCDDIEDDEQVENKDRRSKFRRWFFRAARQALSLGGKIRVHGTILQEDALLARLRKNQTWKVLFYKAHKSYSDFSELLWSERWSMSSLRIRQLEFEGDGDSAGYSQEFLNTPLDNATAYLRKQDFLPMTEEDRVTEKVIAVGVDFAISKRDHANRTSFTVGGKCVKNLIHHVDQYVGRWGSDEIIEKFFEIDFRWKPKVFFVENGQIWLTIKSILIPEMIKRGQELIFEELTSKKDKAVRGRAFQKKMRVGACRFDKDSDWYSGYEAELLSFTGVSEAKADDQFDSTANLHIGLDNYHEIDEEDFMEEDDFEWIKQSANLMSSGRVSSTGY